MEKVSGKIGDLVFRRYEDGVVISRKADTAGRTPTTGQLNQQERFRQAAVYARSAMDDPATKTVYVAAGEKHRKPAFALAVGDFFKVPAVDVINLDAYTGKTGDRIVVRASDDIEVIAVGIVIRRETGEILEQGSALLEQGSWRYTAQTEVDLTAGPVAVDVTAADRPGNKTTKTQLKN